MSVLGAEPVEFQRFSGYRDRRYPEGYWFGFVTVTGDATGGTASLAINLNQAGRTTLSSRLFSLEQFAVHSDRVAAEAGRLEMVNLSGPSLGAFRGIITLPMVNFSQGNALEPSAYAMLPLFVGSQRDPALVSSIAVVMSNTDLIFRTFEAQGYWWGARSVLEPGGPQRPPTGLYQT